MFETLDKLMMAGMGAMSMTKEKAEKIFDEAVKKGMAEKEHKQGFVKEMLDSTKRLVPTLKNWCPSRFTRR